MQLLRPHLLCQGVRLVTALLFGTVCAVLPTSSAAAGPPYALKSTLAPSDLQSLARLGTSCAMNSNYIALGAPLHSSDTVDAVGAVRIFDANTGALLHSIAGQTAFEQFGSAVALQGNLLAVGGGNRVQLYDLASATPTVAVQTINDPTATPTGDSFGAALKWSGNRLVVGAPQDSDSGASGAGSAFVYMMNGTNAPVLEATLNNPTPATQERFGTSVAVDGNLVVVGAPLDSTGGSSAGIAYVYDLSSGTPTTPVHTLVGSLANGQSGLAVAVSGTSVAVGAPFYLADSNEGRAFLYDIGSATPTTPSLTLANPLNNTTARFGMSLAFNGTQLAVGDTGSTPAPGYVHVYDLASATPTTPVRSLSKPSATNLDQFGTSLAWSGNKLLVGAARDDLVAIDAGGGYLFDLASATPTIPVLTLISPQPAARNHFGASTAISDGWLAVGAPRDDLDTQDAGTVTLYDLTSSTPGSPAYVLTDAGTSSSQFGTSVAMSGTKLVVGAPAVSNLTGKALVFDRSTATPTVPVLSIANPTPSFQDQFGSFVAISGSLVTVSARGDDTQATNDGAVYVYDLNSATPATPVHQIFAPAGSRNLTGVAMSGSRLVVNSTSTSTGLSQVHVYDLAGASPTVPVLTLAPNLGGFGSGLAIEGARLVVGAFGSETALVYDLAGAAPSTPVLTLTNPVTGAFGASVALSGNYVIVGDSKRLGTDVAAYTYDLTSATPATPVASFINPGAYDGSANFHCSVSMQGAFAVMGAKFVNSSAFQQGTAWVYGPPSSDATLSALVPSLGTLSPTFGAATTSYSIALPGGTSSMTLTPTATQAGATLTVNGNAVTSGNASGSIPLTFGANTITIVVTAEDTVTTKTYTLTANVAGSGTLAFANSVFTVASSAGGSTADIVVQRSGSNEGAITCTLSSTDGSAIAPTHYTAQSSTPVSLANGVTTATISIPITAGATTTTAKAFAITLANINSGATLGSPTTVTVVILPPASATELVKPIVAFTAPVNAATIVDTLPVTLSGTATDNVGIAKVQVSADNGLTFTDAIVTSIGGTNVTWTTTITPISGLNTIKARAIDFKGNVSLLAIRTFTHLRTLTVGVSGPANSGIVTTGFMPTSARQVGKSYTIIATPKLGFVFDGWTVNNTTGTGITPLKMELPSLTFIMQPGLTLTAKFMTNPFTASVTGAFSGLAMPSGAQPVGGTIMSNSTVGLFTGNLTTTGALTGAVKIDGLSLPITAQCDNTGVARFGVTRTTSVNLLRPGKPWLVLSLTADLTGATNRITGTLTELNKTAIIAQSIITADRHHFNGTTSIVPAGYVKSYTGRIKARASQGTGFTTHDYPQGDGYVTFKLLANGSVTGSGKLADDTAITISGNLSQAKHFPLFQSLYASKGCIAADTALDDTQADTDATAMNMLWFRPFQVVQWYPYGWSEGILVDLLASKYTPAPATVFSGLAATNPTTGNTNLTFTDGLLTSSVTKFVNLTTANVLTKAPTTDASFTFVPAFTTGLISGTFKHTDNTLPKWQGVLMQKGANKGGHGYFMSSKPAVLNYLGESGAMHWLAK